MYLFHSPLINSYEYDRNLKSIHREVSETSSSGFNVIVILTAQLIKPIYIIDNTKFSYCTKV